MPKIIIAIIIVLVGFGAYYLGTKNTFQPSPSPSPSPTTNPTPSLSPTPQITPTPTPSPSPSIKPELLNTIKSAVASKNTAALEGYMTDTVSVTIEATECCGPMTKVKAIAQMDYLNSATLPWNFEADNPIALQLKQKNPQAFPEGVIIGTSADRKLVAFTLNQDKTKIEKLYMAADYKLQGI